MTDSFRALPEEKKERVFAAAIQVFAARDYKHASTDDEEYHETTIYKFSVR